MILLAEKINVIPKAIFLDLRGRSEILRIIRNVFGLY